MGLLSWLFSGRTTLQDRRAVLQVLPEGVLLEGGRLRLFDLDSGELVLALDGLGPRVAVDPHRVVAFDGRCFDREGQPLEPTGFDGLPWLHQGRVIQLAGGELHLDGQVIRAAWLNPSMLLRFASSPGGRLALLDPMWDRPALLSGNLLAPLEGTRGAPVMDGCFDGEELITVQQGRRRRWSAQGALLEEDQPHGLQTLAVAPGATLGLDAQDRYELRTQDGARLLPGRAPERPRLLPSPWGLVCETWDGFVLGDTHYPLPLGRRGRRPLDDLAVTPAGVLVGGDPPLLVSPDGRCLHRLEC